MGPRPPQLGSFRYALEHKSKERLLSIRNLESDDYYDDDEFFDDGGCFLRRIRRAVRRVVGGWEWVKALAVKGWEFGRSDPRKVVFAAKMGLALTLVSLLIFFKEPFKEVSRYSVWAILTVVVVFEFSIGSTLSKGFNRALGTLSAGGISLGVAYLCTMTGQWEEHFIVISIFIVGFLVSYIKLYPEMKPYEYGFRVFLLTFCMVMVSGNRTRQFIETAVSRFLLIAIGAGVGLGVNICIYPIWAGEDLHNLVAKNFSGVAKSLEGCVNGYLQCVEYERIPSKILTYQASDDPVYSGYRTAVESKAQEDTLLGFAIWEPPHGPYKMLKYPWKSYTRVSGALRHCAFTVMALHGCVLSEIQAPPERRQVFSSELLRVSVEGSKVLKEIGDRIKNMRKLSTKDLLYEVHEAAEELQKKIDSRSYLLVNSENWEIGGKHAHPEADNEITDGPKLQINSTENRLGAKSQSETVLDLHSFPFFSKGWDIRNPSMTPTVGVSPPREAAAAGLGMINPQVLWPVRQSFNLVDDNVLMVEEESKTYESASALSLATFASLLIEFVARLQNVVNAFEELAEVAKFRDCVDEPVVQDDGFWTKLGNLFRRQKR